MCNKNVENQSYSIINNFINIGRYFRCSVFSYFLKLKKKKLNKITDLFKMGLFLKKKILGVVPFSKTSEFHFFLPDYETRHESQAHIHI